MKIELTMKSDFLTKLILSGNPEAYDQLLEEFKKRFLESKELEAMREIFNITITRCTKHSETEKTENVRSGHHPWGTESKSLDISDEEIEAIDSLVDYTAKSSGTLLLMSQMSGTDALIKTDDVLEANGLALTCRKLTKRLKEKK